MTPRQRAASALGENELEHIIDKAARAIEADRRRGGDFTAGELYMLDKALDFAAQFPVRSELPITETVELRFKLRNMATRAGT